MLTFYGKCNDSLVKCLLKKHRLLDMVMATLEKLIFFKLNLYDKDEKNIGKYIARVVGSRVNAWW